MKVSECIPKTVAALYLEENFMAEIMYGLLFVKAH